MRVNTMLKCAECEDEEARFPDPRSPCFDVGEHVLCKGCLESAYVDLIYDAESEVRELRRQAAKLGLDLS